MTLTLQQIFFSESEDEIVATQGDDDLGSQPLL
jgi:hypothetical protein